jgi:serine protease Do
MAWGPVRSGRVWFGIALLAAFAGGFLFRGRAVTSTVEAQSPAVAEAEDTRQRAAKLNINLAESRCTALVCAAEEVASAVVSIGAEQTAYARWPGFINDGFMSVPAPIVQEYKRKVPFLGSGIVVRPEGLIVTNYHVVEGARSLFVMLPDKREVEAKLVDSDPVVDIAILKIEAKGLRVARLGNSDDVRLGEWVLAVGNPYGALLEDPTPTITAGVVSAINRFFMTKGKNPKLYQGMIQSDAAINPGNSGGALVNAAGEVIGVNTFIFTETGGSVGVGFAIPINRVRSILQEVQQFGHLRRNRVDFELVDITPRIQAALGLSSAQGVLVYSVEAGGPAEKSGMIPGDIILSVNQHKVNSRAEVLTHLFGSEVGTNVGMMIQREGKSRQVQYSIAERR